MELESQDVSAVAELLFNVKMTEAQIRRFWAKVDRGLEDECWFWNAAQYHDGYGHLTLQCKDYRAHRVSYFLTHGPFPDELFLLHSCDMPLCVNPKHLTPGTHQANVTDCVTKKRHSFGESNGHAILTFEQVHEIRMAYETEDITQQKLADRYGVSIGLICGIINRKRWAINV